MTRQRWCPGTTTSGVTPTGSWTWSRWSASPCKAMAELPNLADLLAQGVSGRGVLVRSDLNVPLDDDGQISDPGRITASAPTLKALADADAKVVVAAHLGRPDGAPDPKYSLKPV